MVEEEEMKTLLLIVSFTFLVSCGEFPEMSDAEAKAFAACLEKNWEPKFQVTTSSRNLTCERQSKK